MTDNEKRALAREIADLVKSDLCNENRTCPLGLTAIDAMKWQGMLKVAGIVGVAAAWTVVAAIASGFVAAVWLGFRHLVSMGGVR